MASVYIRDINCSPPFATFSQQQTDLYIDDPKMCQSTGWDCNIHGDVVVLSQCCTLLAVDVSTGRYGTWSYQSGRREGIPDNETYCPVQVAEVRRRSQFDWMSYSPSLIDVGFYWRGVSDWIQLE